jgi:G3E family GTPase
MGKLLANIQTNIITGFLGAGKSTAILNLMQQKPQNERWAILVNEFGEVGIDGGLLSGQAEPDIFIREVPGGCMCCAAGLPMQMAMNMLLARAKPDRLIIEPTGLGHPFEVMRVLAAENYEDLLDLRSTLTLVDARKVSDSRYTLHKTFNQQIEIADIVLASKSDLYGGADLSNLQAYLSSNGITPQRKLKILANGQIEPGWLDEKARAWNLDSVKISTPIKNDQPEVSISFPPEGFIHLSNKGEGFESHGWLFQGDFAFEKKKISALLQRTRVDRLKAIIKTPGGDVGFNFSGDDLEELTLRDISDSRIEVISNGGFDANDFEAALLDASSR